MNLVSIIEYVHNKIIIQFCFNVFLIIIKIYRYKIDFFKKSNIFFKNDG